ncbi:MAG: YARHG domain-containing protein [Ferruginibacter sp.]
MKPSLFLSVLMAGLFCSCNSSSGNKDVKNAGKDAPVAVSNPAVNLLGSYVGPFGDNKITLLITRISGDSIEGRSVVGGNDRPYSGIVKLVNDKYTVSAKEPGDDKYDGVFNFTIDSKQPDVVTGNWAPNVAGAHLGPKDFSLQRKAFRYLMDVGEYPQASKRLLKEDDVNNLMKEDLETMRNEIFARHGYCFKKKNLRELFEDKDWYIPNTVDVKKDLTDIEKKNIALIKHFEKYAEEYGDDFGR